jgi:hypothetical protein
MVDFKRGLKFILYKIKIYKGFLLGSGEKGSKLLTKGGERNSISRSKSEALRKRPPSFGNID